jgi:glycosyltransferase involved in cell wall biosynthesis
MPAEPVVGVVIPARNAERWLAQALDSVVVQRHRPIDVVVVDDRSEDSTAAVADGYGPPVRLVRAQRGGTGATRNRGVEVVRGDLLAFLDADDLWTPTRLEDPVLLLTERPELDIVFGQVRSFATTVHGVPQGLDAPRPAHLPAAMVIRRASFDRVGPFQEGRVMGESLDWLLRARELGLRELTVDRHVLWRRVHADNTTVRHREARVEYARALKASLDRRRAIR